MGHSVHSFGVAAGQHSVTVSKAGYSPDNRTVEVASGSRLMVMTRLAVLAATLSVSSTPAGANVYIDGKDTGKLTPRRFRWIRASMWCWCANPVT